MTVNDSLRVLCTMNDPRTGGPQLRSLAVAKRLRKRRIETEFLLPNGDNNFDELASEEGFMVHRPNISRIHPLKMITANASYLLNFPLAVRRIARVIDERSIDVVHTNMSTSFCAAIAAARSDVSLAWHFNDTLVPRPVKDIAARTAMRLTDQIVVASESVHDYYFPTWVDSRTIYSPVDLAEFNPASVQPVYPVTNSEQSEEPLVIGTVANVNPIKGLEYFIRSVAELNKRTDRQVHAPIVGAVLESRRDYYNKLLALCKELGIEENIHFLGKRDDVPALLGGFDVFVLASVAEACPMVVLEAMAMERPVVATRVGGIPEQIDDGEHGWVVPPKNPDELAAAIVDALEDETEANRRGALARDRVRSKFSLEQCVTRHEELYRALA